MDSVTSDAVEEARRRRRATAQLKEALRALSGQLSLLDRQVSARAELKDVDLDCLDVIGRHGPISPSALARQAGLHPATLTGILDRLERAGWIARERDTADRRAVLIKALPDRSGELFGLYSGMNRAMDEICAGYTETELHLVTGFLRQVTGAGGEATAALSQG